MTQALLYVSAGTPCFMLPPQRTDHLPDRLLAACSTLLTTSCFLYVQV